MRRRRWTHGVTDHTPVSRRWYHEKVFFNDCQASNQFTALRRSGLTAATANCATRHWGADPPSPPSPTRTPRRRPHARDQGFRCVRDAYITESCHPLRPTSPTRNHSMLQITKQKLIHDVVNYPTGACTAHTAHAAPAGARALSPRCLRCKPAMCMPQEVQAIQHHNTKDRSTPMKVQKARRCIAMSSSCLRFLSFSPIISLCGTREGRGGVWEMLVLVADTQMIGAGSREGGGCRAMEGGCRACRERRVPEAQGVHL